MSEENNNLFEQGKQKAEKIMNPENTLTIQIDNDKRIESLEKQKDELLQKVSIYEHEQSKKTAESAGSPPLPPRYEGASLEPPANPSNDNWQTKQYASQEDCINEISRRAKAGDKDAQMYEAQIYKKNFSGNWEYAFDFDVNDGFGSKAWYKKTIPIKAGMSPEEKEAAKEYNRKLRKAQSHWKRIE
jgi:hypothetical protein